MPGNVKPIVLHRGRGALLGSSSRDVQPLFLYRQKPQSQLPRICAKRLKELVRVAGVEPTTFGSGGRHSIQLSYTRNKRRRIKLVESIPDGNQFRRLHVVPDWPLCSGYFPMNQPKPVLRLPKRLIPIRFQVETNSLVCQAPGFVARQSQIAADMLLPRVSPRARHPARLSLNLNAHWNKAPRLCQNSRRTPECSGLVANFSWHKRGST